MSVDPPEIEIWYRVAANDLVTARYLHEGARYATAIFWCQQAVEKALKSLYMLERDQMHPLTHSLLKLADATSFPRDKFDFLRELATKYTETRYPVFPIEPPSEMYDAPYSLSILQQSEECLKWIRDRLQQANLLRS
jgi:HEPN domain-containing protein